MSETVSHIPDMTPEQRAHFDRACSFLYEMIKKYGPVLDAMDAEKAKKETYGSCENQIQYEN